MNAKQLRARLQAKADEQQVKATRGLLRGAHEIVAKSVRLTPKDTGNLRRQQSADQVSDDTVVVHVDAEYAVVVHEDMQAYHEIGQAKYLATAVTEEKDTVARMVAEETSV